MKRSSFVLFLMLVLLAARLEAQRVPSPPNVLFIAIDDLRPDLGCYGHPLVQSPHLDRLAQKAQLFTHHYVTVPTCGASRYSLLTGAYPRNKTAVSNDAIKKLIAEQPGSDLPGSDLPRNDQPESFVENLKNHGYYTVGIGKISHYVDGLLYGYEEPVGTKRELPYSWDEMLFDAGKWGTGWNAFFGYADGSNRQSRNKQVKPYESADVADTGYPDGLTAALAVEKLQELSGKEKPFFLGVGFFKPHLPFTAPQKYWDLYERDDIALTPSPDIPENIHTASLHGSGEFNHYALGEEKASLTEPLSDEYARKLRHAYYASVSYVDAQVGKVLDELERLGLEENTIVVVWSDHGWQLGDHRVWGKHTNFEQSLRSVLMIKTPQMTEAVRCDKIVGTVDIYPTLTALCKVPLEREVDGQSLLPLIADPASDDWQDYTFSYYKNGISLRTDRYRLTKYYREEQPALELYDHQHDPYENRNVAAEQPEVVEKLMPLWKQGDTGLYADK
jgi:arylsulfatase A-like enzyme